MDLIFRRRLAALNYEEPETVLHRVMPIVVALLQQPESVAHLSGKEKNAYLHQHQAAFLAFMLKHMVGSHAKVTLSMEELDDFDCVIKGDVEGQITYKPVQLKHLPDHATNPNIEIQTIIDGIKQKYRSSPELVVAIWVNRDTTLDLASLDFTGLAIEQLWFLGDLPTGEPTIEGGGMSDLLAGVCLFGWMTHGKGHFKQIRFKPPTVAT
jgi:hypothetical protein